MLILAETFFRLFELVRPNDLYDLLHSIQSWEPSHLHVCRKTYLGLELDLLSSDDLN